MLVFLSARTLQFFTVQLLLRKRVELGECVLFVSFYVSFRAENSRFANVFHPFSFALEYIRTVKPHNSHHVHSLV